jgi:peptidoglycan/LPS O-acetylase OafA/YrhL
MDRTPITNVPILDSLRAFAALSVCLFHFVCTTTGYFENEQVLNVFSVGKYGVQLFFVISGFIIPWAMFYSGYKIKNFFVFFFKRLCRLEPPYLLSIALALAILFFRQKLLGRSNDHIQVSPAQVLFHFGYLIPFFKNYQWLNQVYWTLAVEFQYYLLIALVYVPLTSGHILLRQIFYLASIVSAFLSPDYLVLYWMPLFLLGILLFLYKIKRISSFEFCMVSLVSVTASLFRYHPGAVIFSIMPIISILYFSEKKILLLNYLGKFSYSIYLIHPLLGASLVNILSHKFTSPIEKFVVIMAGVLFTILSSWFTYILVEKPSKRLSSSIKYSR